jgi:hypothetical protein
MQFIAAANVATGVYNITISAMSSGITQTAPLTVAVLSPANYALTVSPAAVTVASGNNSTVTITTAAGLGFNGDVSLHASPLPPGTSATFSPAAIAAPGSGNSTLTLAAGANTPAGTYKVTITATARLVTKTATLTLTVVPGPNYALAVTTNMLNIFPGYNATLPITTSADAAFNAAVKLTVSGLPSGVTATFAPASIAAPGSGASILKLSATSTTTPGGYSFTITAASGNIVRTMQPILMVTNPATSSPPPVLFYSDLDSGPATGGEGGTDGAFVCVYGENFGATQGASTLTLGGVELSAYKLWSDPGAPYTPGYYAKACGQISHLSPSGPRTLQLTTANGGSNALPFTVRPGAIYWVTTTGSNTKGTGSQAKPWATITKCRTEVGIGGICLIGNGVVLNTVDGTNIALRLDSSGSGTTTDSCGLDYSTPCGPKTIVAYPGAAVSVDVHTLGTGRALQSYSTTGDVSYWTIAGMLFNGNDFSVRFQYGTNIRFIDNEVLCGGANCDWSSDSAGLNTKYMNYLWLYGNRFHDIGCHEDDSTPTSYLTSPEHCAGGTTYTAVSSSGTTLTTTYAMSTVLVSGDVITINGQLRRTIKSSQQRVGANEQYTLDAPFSPDIASGSVTSWHWRDYAPSKEFHNIYFSTNTNDVWFGWNSVNGNGKACRGVLFNSTGGSPQYDLHVHDNLIHDTVCDGINFSTIDPSRGVVEAYNNVIYNAGTGPDPIDGPAYYTCILNQGGGSGTIQVYNNTLYNCGNNPAAFYPGDRGAVSSKSKLVTLSLTNNIIAQTGGIPYQAASSISSTLTGAANLFYGSGLAPNELSTAAIDSQNPQFVDISAQNFHLQAASPAIGSGTRVLAAHTDLDGIMQGSPYSLGAYGTPPR